MSSTDEAYVPPVFSLDVRRSYGKSLDQWMTFKKAADSGLRVQLHGQNYVAVDRKTWETMTLQVGPKIMCDEAPDDVVPPPSVEFWP